MPKKGTGLSARQVQMHKVKGMFADGGGALSPDFSERIEAWIYRIQIEGRRSDMGLDPKRGRVEKP
jgi:hypothetical protein